MAISKFTFKTEKPTGKWRSFSPTSYYVKYGNDIIGNIYEEPWRVAIMVMKSNGVEGSNPNCPWMWLRFKDRFESLQAAKDWLNEHFKEITDKYKFPTE